MQFTTNSRPEYVCVTAQSKKVRLPLSPPCPHRVSWHAAAWQQTGWLCLMIDPFELTQFYCFTTHTLTHTNTMFVGRAGPASVLDWQEIVRRRIAPGDTGAR